MTGPEPTVPEPTVPEPTEPEARVELTDASATRAYGRALAGLLRAGDLVLLSGALGAGKTTLTQGIGAGLGVRGQVASPTFIIARVHPSLGDGPALVHVDAYRLGSLDEVETLDLEASLEESVTVVEWGSGLLEGLAPDRLEIDVQRPHGGLDLAALAARAQETAAETETETEAATEAETEAEEADPAGGTRTVHIRARGERWSGVQFPVVG